MEKVGEYAESGESAELYKYVDQWKFAYNIMYQSLLHIRLTSPFCMTAEVNGNLITLMYIYSTTV